jgi:hypothetical protein
MQAVVAVGTVQTVSERTIPPWAAQSCQVLRSHVVVAYALPMVVRRLSD